MDYRVLGNTGIKVSRMCFGALTIGPLQANLPVAEGARVISQALDGGVNFIDTAKLYKTYPYIREAIKGRKNQVVLVSKSYDFTASGMEKSLHEALSELDREYIDVFLLHEQETELTVKGHWEAVDYLIKAKEKGLVRAIGLSTHMVAGVIAACRIPEIEVVHPMINYSGIGIGDGTTDDMLAAMNQAYKMGKGIYGMKALGGGNLIAEYQTAIDFALGLEELASIAIGMKSTAEVDYNLKVFNNLPVPEDLQRQVARTPRKLHIEGWCIGCGRCIDRCGNRSLSIIDGKAVVAQEKCLKCGYCGSACPEFCIKII